MNHYFSRSGILIFCLCIGLNGFISAQQKVTNDFRFKVVINHEEQYSIVPFEHTMQKGWKETKMKGTLSNCQAYIEEVWTDMRPLSVQALKLGENTKYSVVINHEEQYSILPTKMKLNKGQRVVKKGLPLADCQAYIEEVWTDMRPLSFRKQRE